MLTKLKDRLDHLMSSKLKWELSRGKATAARARDEAEHAMKVFAIRVYGARGAAAVRAFDAARALRAPGRRRRQRGVALPRSNRRSKIRFENPIRKPDPKSQIRKTRSENRRGRGEGRDSRVQAGRVRACPRFFEFATESRAFSRGCPQSEYNPRSKGVGGRSGEVAGATYLRRRVSEG